jgi:hypothetical protein
VAGLVIVALALDVIGVVLTAIGTFHLWCCVGAEFLVFGPLVLALGITTSLAAAGLRIWFVLLAVFAILAILLIGIDAFGWFGLGSTL